MSKLMIYGGRPLKGQVRVQGSKNSALPIIAAAMLTDEMCIIENCPDLSDISAALEIIKSLGAEAEYDGHTAVIRAGNADGTVISEALMRRMRSSVLFLGTLLSRFGCACISYPGGCALGLRPIDIHLDSMERLGVKFAEEDGYIKAELKRLVPDTVTFMFPSVGATENIMLAAVRAKGTTYIKNAAREPEICDLARFLNSCGADIKGAGESTIVIEGAEKLHGCEFSVMPDRIVTATYLAAAAVTGSELLVKDALSENLSSVLSSFEQAGCKFLCKNNEIYIKAPQRLKKMETVRTMPYPGFPTDCQAIIMAMAAVADGTTLITENIFESRFRHVGELNRMGADITVSGRTASVRGVETLYGAQVGATDLRGGMALVLASLAAEGKSRIDCVEYIDRGYESTETELKKIGADIRRETDYVKDDAGRA